MTGPVCPHCGDLAHGCACPPEPYVGELSADVIYPCWLSDIDRANFAEHERDHLRDQLAAEREAYAHGLALVRADLHREREANRPLRHEVEQLRAAVADFFARSEERTAAYHASVRDETKTDLHREAYAKAAEATERLRALVGIKP